jgi:hypothetical protein
MVGLQKLDIFRRYVLFIRHRAHLLKDQKVDGISRGSMVYHSPGKNCTRI